MLFTLHPRNGKIGLTASIKAHKPRNQLHRNCKWQGTKINNFTRRSAVCSRCDLSEGNCQIMKSSKWIVCFTLMDNAMFLSVYFSDFPKVEWIYPLYLKWSAIVERTIPAWDKNVIKERSKNEDLQIEVDIDRYGIYLTGAQQSTEQNRRNKGFNMWKLIVFACYCELTAARRWSFGSDNNVTRGLLLISKRDDGMGFGIDVTLGGKHISKFIWIANDMIKAATVCNWSCFCILGSKNISWLMC